MMATEAGTKLERRNELKRSTRSSIGFESLVLGVLEHADHVDRRIVTHPRKDRPGASKCSSAIALGGLGITRHEKQRLGLNSVVLDAFLPSQHELYTTPS